MILNNALKCYVAISHEMLWLKSFLESHKECQCKQVQPTALVPVPSSMFVPKTVL